eukprot:5661213-Alexandrium_andersonii.AAC.1
MIACAVTCTHEEQIEGSTAKGHACMHSHLHTQGSKPEQSLGHMRSEPEQTYACTPWLRQRLTRSRSQIT